MNIFFLDYQPDIAAKYHVDKHVVKMILETSQLLSTAHHILDPDENHILLYKPTHVNHPSAKWVRESSGNYLWAWSLLQCLCKEYTRRYGKYHKCDTTGLVNELLNPPKNIPVGGMTPVKLAMPDEYKTDNPVEAYRNYYKGAKSHMFSWKTREVPEWINQ